MPLDIPVDAVRRRAPAGPVPVGTLVGLAAALAAAVASRRLGWLSPAAAAVLAIPAAHGALLAVALARADRHWRRDAALLIALLAIAAGAAALSAWGALAYLAVPATLVGLATRRRELGAVGLCAPVPGWTLVVGAAAGAFLGAHLLISGGLTFGYGVALRPLRRYLAVVAYDLGANVPSAECFFRGVVFNGVQRRWPVGLAVAASTAASLARYLVDPALPHAAETIAGAVFYLTLVSVVSCALFWRSGSVLPGALAAAGFFAAYRALAGGW